MKVVFTIIIFVFSLFFASCQLPYSWTSGVNPGWVASGVLQYRAGCNSVTTNCTGTYSNNTSTSYSMTTSLNTSCANASTIEVSYLVNGESESGYDFLYLDYSTNNGGSWTNMGTWSGTTFGANVLINGLILPDHSNIRFRFRFTSDGAYPWPWSVNPFAGFKILDFDVKCNVVLPVELLSFSGTCADDGEVLLLWSTASEQNSDKFTVETSKDGESWSFVGSVPGAGNSNATLNYQIEDKEKC